MADLTLRNGTVVTPSGIVRGGLTITGERITSVGPDESLERGATEIDLENKIVLPGLIDPHTHMGIGDEATYEKFARDFASESRDAATGGITTILTTTRHGTRPRTEALKAAREAGEGRSFVDYRITASIVTEEHVDEIPDLYRQGVRSFKFYLGYRGAQAQRMGVRSEGTTWALFYRACEAIASLPGAFAMIHAEDPSLREITVPRIRAAEPAGSLQAWHRANPDLLEPMQIYPAALVAREAGAPIYVVHVSSAEGVDLIPYLRDRAVEITGETIVAFLRYTDREGDERGLGAYGKVQPPIRSAADRDRLWRGLDDGAISCVGTDSVMFPMGTRSGDFWDAAVGLGPGMGATLPIMYTAGVLGGRISLEKLAKVLSENTARQFGLYPQKGTLQPGADADIVVLDPDRRMTLRGSDLKSAAGYSIYDGLEVQGVPAMTFVRGRLVAEYYRMVPDTADGRFVPLP